MEKIDVTIIGSGVIGLAISFVLSGLDKETMVVERNASFGQETSSRNSEVIHSGIYYPKDTLKSQTCIRGRNLLYKLCSKHNIPYQKIEKVLVANNKEEFTKLQGIYQNALVCNIKDLRFLDKREIKKLEPDIKAETAILFPETGIIDSHRLMKFFLETAKDKNVDFAFSVEVINIRKHGNLYEITVREPEGDSFSFQSKIVINCAGLWSDKIAEMVGIDVEKHFYRLHYCKGKYFRIRNPKKFSITHLVYPPPTKVSLGIHITPDLGGGLRLGPDARYVSNINYDIDEGEKGLFLRSIEKFLPALKLDDLVPDTAGIRPKLQAEKEDFRDFVIEEASEKGFPGFVNLIGIESPGLTSCLAIAEIVKNLLRL